MQVQATKLCHSGEPDTSREAAEKLVKSGELSRQERFVFCAIQIHLSYRAQDNESDDFTAKEVVENAEDTNRFAINYHLIQRRLSGLACKGLIERIVIGKKQIGATDLFKPIYKKRNGCAVWRLKNDND